ncbi:MAG: hypothetical protein GX075_08630 [Firmicutes bacterium]|nr:hypothetical protein [Bacillota bacterium]
MLKKGLIAIFIIIFGCLTTNFKSYQCLGDNLDVHHKSYKIYLINTYYSGLLLETANIDKKNKTIEINYQPSNPDSINQIELSIGEIIGTFKDIRIIQTVTIENRRLALKERYIQEIFPLKEFKEGMTIIIWVKNVTSKFNDFIPLKKEQLLERAHAIWWEQYRLTNMESADIYSEVTRNYEE